MGRLVAAVAIALVAGGTAAGSAPSSQPPQPPLLGLTGPPGALTRIEAATLRPVGRRVPTAAHNFGWSVSPDGALAAAGTDGTGDLRLYDVRAMRRAGDVDLHAQGLVFATAWAAPRLVLAVVVSPGCCGLGDTTVTGVDAAARRVVWSRRLNGSLQAGGSFARSVVLVLGPKRGLGQSRLAVVGPQGAVRSAPLPWIRSGIAHSGARTPEAFTSETWNPGLAIDPRGRAFVVQHAPVVAEVDLRTLRAVPHELRGRTTLAALKGEAGPTRSAVWLGNARIAVTGVDSSISKDAAGHLQQHERAAGLAIVDTRAWTVRRIDTGTSRFVLAGRTLVCFGVVSDSAAQRLSGGGLRGYSLDGSPLFHRYGDDPISFAVPVGSRLLVAGAAGSRLFDRGALVDPRTGRELRRVGFSTTPVSPTADFWY